MVCLRRATVRASLELLTSPATTLRPPEAEDTMTSESARCPIVVTPGVRVVLRLVALQSDSGPTVYRLDMSLLWPSSCFDPRRLACSLAAGSSFPPTDGLDLHSSTTAHCRIPVRATPFVRHPPCSPAGPGPADSGYPHHAVGTA